MPVHAALKQWWFMHIFMCKFWNISFFNELNCSVVDISLDLNDSNFKIKSFVIFLVSKFKKIYIFSWQPPSKHFYQRAIKKIK